MSSECDPNVMSVLTMPLRSPAYAFSGIEVVSVAYMAQGLRISKRGARPQEPRGLKNTLWEIFVSSVRCGLDRVRLCWAGLRIWITERPCREIAFRVSRLSGIYTHQLFFLLIFGIHTQRKIARK